MAHFSLFVGSLLRISGLLATLSFCQAAIFTDPSALPRTTYDFIVVGGGSAGSVLGNRLSAFSPNITVLVVEAGFSNDGVLPSIVPFLAATLVPASPETWNFTTVPQVALTNRVLPYARGKLLGGSSSVSEYHSSLRFLDDNCASTHLTKIPILPFLHRFYDVYSSVCR